MKSRDRFVFDTSVLVRAVLISGSLPFNAFQKARQNGQILLSVPAAAELADVLGRPKFDRYVTREDRERFLTALVQDAVLIEITETIQVCRDRRDDKFLELAVSGQARCIVTADEDLLVLHPFRGISILSIEQFLSIE